MKYDLQDTTFVIPVKFDSKEREENLQAVLRFIDKHFIAHVCIIVDADSVAPDWLNGINSSKSDLYDAYPHCCIEFVKSKFTSAGIFHRTAIINAGIRLVDTPYFAIYDTDCIFNPDQIFYAVMRLRGGDDVVYPYDGHFIDVSRQYIIDGTIEKRTSCATGSVGGAVFLRTQSYRAAGMDNENLISHCPDDVERHARMLTLGYKVSRIEGECWHITHPITLNSRPVNDYTEANLAEFNKVKEMSAQELREYIKTWAWI